MKGESGDMKSRPGVWLMEHVVVITARRQSCSSDSGTSISIHMACVLIASLSSARPSARYHIPYSALGLNDVELRPLRMHQ